MTEGGRRSGLRSIGSSLLANLFGYPESRTGFKSR